MFAWLTAISAAFTLASEIMRYLRNQETGNKTKAVENMRSMNQALKKARKNNDTSEIEKQFRGLGINSPDSKLSDK